MKIALKTELITDYIKRNNLTIKEFCKRCKISTNTYYRIMSGETRIRIIAIYNILTEMNVLSEDIIIYK